MKKLSLFTILLALCMGFLQAQTYTLTLGGQVTDLNGGAPIPNYPVDVVIDSNFFGFSHYNTVTTDANGNYTDVVSVPGNVSGGNGYTGLRDCTPSGYPTNSFTFTSGSGSITNLDFAICTSPSGGCQSGFAFYWTPGTTMVQFNDSSFAANDTVIGWSWNFGDSSAISTQQDPSHVFPGMGSYTVCLTITTSQGCTSTSCQTVYLGNAPSCSATLTPSINPGGVVTFTAAGSGTGAPVNYFFDFGDGAVANGSSATVNHTYLVSGTYTACVYILFSDSCSASACATFTISGALNCQAAYGWYPDSSGQYSIIVVNNSVSAGPATYTWTWGDGSTSSGAYPSHQYNGPGTYTVCVTISSVNPTCTDTYCDSLVVVNKVNAPFTVNVIANGATAVAPQVPTALEVTIAPNPARDYFQVNLGLEQAADVAITLMDMTGKVIAVQNAGELNAGNQSLRVSTQELAAGLYMARVQAGDRFSTHKVMIAR